MSNKIKIIIFLLLGAIGWGVYHWFFQSFEPATAERVIRPPVVDAEKAIRGPITRRITTNGALVASQSVVMMSEVEGRIVGIPFQQGQKVEKGQILIEIDPATYQVQQKEAQAKVDLARSEYARADSLLKKDFGTTAARDKALSSLKVYEAELEGAQLRLSQTKIRAPFSGTVGLRTVSVGTFVAKNQELVSLVDLDPIFVDFSVPESYSKDIEVGQAVSVLVEGADSLPFASHIVAIDPKADPMTHSIQVRAELTNEENQFKPGQFARVSMELGKEEHALLIPDVAVEREEDQAQDFVYRVVNGLAVRTEVTLGMKEGEWVQVLSGVKEGEWVVTAGQMKLRDGMPVRLPSQVKNQTKPHPLSKEKKKESPPQ